MLWRCTRLWAGKCSCLMFLFLHKGIFVKLHSKNLRMHKFRLMPSAVRMTVIASCLIATGAQAQEEAEPTNWLGDKTEVTLGLGASITSRYIGSADSHASVIPVLSVRRGIFFADFLRGIGAEYSTQSGFYISPSLAYDMGRSDHNSTRKEGSKKLQGMGEIKGGGTFNLEIGQQITPWLFAKAGGEFVLSGQKNRGHQYFLGLEAALLETKKNSILISFGTHAGDQDYNQTYFGVTQAQSQSSRFTKFGASSGIYGYSLTANLSHGLDAHWSRERTKRASG